MISERVTTIFLTCLAGTAPQAQDIEPLSAGTLQAAYFIADAQATTVSAYLYLPYGEIDNPYAEGLAHYSEHLGWLNGFGLAKADFDRETNASTTLFRIEYHFNAPPEDLEHSLQVLAKTLTPIRLDPQFMEQERGIIAREYDFRVRESIWADFNQSLDRATYGDHPITRSVMGTPNNIANFSLTDARAFHKMTHTVDQAVLLVYGNTDLARVQSAVTSVFGGENTTPRLPPRDFYFAPMGEGFQSATVPKSDRQLVVIRKRIHLPQTQPYQRRVLIATLLQKALLSPYDGSLAKPLRFDDFIAQRIWINIDYLDQNDLLLTIESEPDLDVTLPRLQQALLQTLSSIAAQGIPVETLQRVRQQYLTRLQELENPAAQVFADARTGIAARQIPIGFETARALVQDIRPAEINALLTRISGEGHLVVRLVNTPTGDKN